MPSITLATASDVDAITALLQANSVARGGALTGQFQRDTVAGMVATAHAVVVARADEQIVGVLFAAPIDRADAPPVIRAMRGAWPQGCGQDAYVYGPACVAASMRGQGMLGLLYAALREQLHGRHAVLFIRSDNAPSQRAHARLGMRMVATFNFAGAAHVVMTDLPAPDHDRSDPGL